MSYMGIGSCILGYADSDVNNAVRRAIDKGSMATLNCPEEVELARVLCRIHPWAKMARFARTGGEAMAIAVRIARTKTGKDTVLFCGYHGWHDWYLSVNLADNKSLDGHLLPGLNPIGVPRALKGTAFPFAYNNTKEFLGLIDKHKHNIGAVVLESIRNVFPTKEFIDTIRRLTRKLGIVLIADEVSAGWRLCVGGAHLVLGIEPDIAVFAKGISNGFPMAAIIGKRGVMEVAQDTFISSTYWTDRVGPAAALATIKKLEQKEVFRHLADCGKEIQYGWKKLAGKHNLKIEVSGIYPLSHFSFKHKKSMVLKTLFTQLMLERGFLATNSYYASYAHKNSHLKKYLTAVDKTFGFIESYISGGNPEIFLKGPVCHEGFERLT
jgi:glutamate-1-semialdehyde aminotransferase